MPTHLGDASKEEDNTHGRRRRRPSRAGLLSVSSHIPRTHGIVAETSMELHTAVTTSFHHGGCKAAVHHNPTWPRDTAQLPPPLRPGKQPSNSSDSTRTRHQQHPLRASSRRRGPSLKIISFVVSDLQDDSF
jgi:hypothetical protein